jgi:hypothetical protein
LNYTAVAGDNMKIIDDLISSLQGGKEKIKLTDEGTIDKKTLESRL